MLVFDSIIFQYDINPVLRGIYLSLPGNCITGLFGYNGSGKSTLINIGAGFLTPVDGNIFIDKKVIPASHDVTRFDSIGYLSQNSFLPGDLSVKEFLHITHINSVHYANDELIIPIMNQKIREKQKIICIFILRQKIKNLKNIKR